MSDRNLEQMNNYNKESSVFLLFNYHILYIKKND